jgi:hypothetical protein
MLPVSVHRTVVNAFEDDYKLQTPPFWAVVGI